MQTNIHRAEALSFSTCDVRRERTMKHALIGIISTVIVAVSAGVENANAQTYGPYGDSQAYTSRPYAAQSRSAVRGGVSRNPDSPAATGGGSLGYNQNLWNW
jgi:hypothetical protein